MTSRALREKWRRWKMIEISLLRTRSHSIHVDDRTSEQRNEAIIITLYSSSIRYIKSMTSIQRERGGKEGRRDKGIRRRKGDR